MAGTRSEGALVDFNGDGRFHLIYVYKLKPLGFTDAIMLTASNVHRPDADLTLIIMCTLFLLRISKTYSVIIYVYDLEALLHRQRLRYRVMLACPLRLAGISITAGAINSSTFCVFCALIKPICYAVNAYWLFIRPDAVESI